MRNLLQSIIKELNDTTYSLLNINSIVEQSSINYITIKEVTKVSVIMATTQNKEPEFVSSVEKAIAGNDFENLQELMKSIGF